MWPALLMALIISIYSVIDGTAVKRTDPLPYAALIYFISAVYMTPYVLVRHTWKALKREFVTYHWRLLLTGALIVIAYLLALWAYRLSSVSYSGAIREVNVVLGAVAGWQFLGEKFGPLRVVGAVVIFAGILVIAIFG
jgi:drug/metabolite transporter (DMT)-like permease